MGARTTLLPRLSFWRAKAGGILPAPRLQLTGASQLDGVLWRWRAMAWIILVGAGLLEIVFAVALKVSEGFTRFWPSAISFTAAAVSFFMLSKALAGLPLGTAYAIWTGIGAVGTALVGIVVLGE